MIRTAAGNSRRRWCSSAGVEKLISTKNFLLVIFITGASLCTAQPLKDTSGTIQVTEENPLLDSVDHMPRHILWASVIPDIIANPDNFTLSFTVMYSGDLTRRISANAWMSHELFKNQTGKVRCYQAGLSYFPWVKRVDMSKFLRYSTGRKVKDDQGEHQDELVGSVYMPMFVKHGFALNYRVNDMRHVFNERDENICVGNPTAPSSAIFGCSGFSDKYVQVQNHIVFGYTYQRQKFYAWINTKGQREHFMSRITCGFDLVKTLQSKTDGYTALLIKDSTGKELTADQMKAPLYIKENGNYEEMESVFAGKTEQRFAPLGWHLYLVGMLSHRNMHQFGITYRIDMFQPSVKVKSQQIVCFSLGFAYVLGKM